MSGRRGSQSIISITREAAGGGSCGPPLGSARPAPDTACRGRRQWAHEMVAELNSSQMPTNDPGLVSWGLRGEQPGRGRAESVDSVYVGPNGCASPSVGVNSRATERPHPSAGPSKISPGPNKSRPMDPRGTIIIYGRSRLLAGRLLNPPAGTMRPAAQRERWCRAALAPDLEDPGDPRLGCHLAALRLLLGRPSRRVRARRPANERPMTQPAGSIVSPANDRTSLWPPPLAF